MSEQNEIVVRYDAEKGYAIEAYGAVTVLPPGTSPEQLTAAIKAMMPPTARVGAWFKGVLKS